MIMTYILALVLLALGAYHIRYIDFQFFRIDEERREWARDYVNLANSRDRRPDMVAEARAAEDARIIDDLRKRIMTAEKVPSVQELVREKTNIRREYDILKTQIAIQYDDIQDKNQEIEKLKTELETCRSALRAEEANLEVAAFDRDKFRRSAKNRADAYNQLLETLFCSGKFSVRHHRSDGTFGKVATMAEAIHYKNEVKS